MVGRAKTNAELQLTDVTRRLSLDAVTFFAGDTLPKSEARLSDTTTWGKFVRIDQAILIGAMLRFGSRGHSLKHSDLADMLGIMEIPALANRGRDDRKLEPELRDSELHDAGTYSIRVPREPGSTVPIELVLDGDSVNFGRAGEEGRRRTLEVARQLVGDSIVVIEGRY